MSDEPWGVQQDIKISKKCFDGIEELHDEWLDGRIVAVENG